MENQHFLNAAGYLFSLKTIIWSCVSFPYYFKGLNIALKVYYTASVFHIDF